MLEDEEVTQVFYADENDDADADHTDEIDVIEDVYAFVQRSETNGNNLGIDRKRPSVLEVSQVWGQVLLDTKHFTKRTHGKNITIGANTGFKWHLLGIDMGWIPRGFEHVLPFTPPMWSEVQSEWKNDFYAPDENLSGNGEHTLFTHDLVDEAYTARVQEDWDGFVDCEDSRYSFEELVEAGKAKKDGDTFEIPMNPGVRLMVDIDGVVFFSHLVPAGARVTSRATDDLDYPFMSIASFVGFLGMLFGLVMWFSAPPAINSSIEIDDDFFAELFIEKPEVDKPKPKPKEAEGEGARPKKEEGKRGSKTNKLEEAKGEAIKKQMLDRQVAENAGIISALMDSDMFATAGLSGDLTDQVGGLMGVKGGQIGNGGLSSRGGGLGGGGKYDGIAGGMGTRGLGNGEHGYGTGPKTTRTEGVIGTVGGDPLIIGALDSALIDKVIKRHMSQIKYCYTRELNKDPSIGGKVTMKFVIANDGSVSNAQVKTSTMGNAAVEGCITKMFLRMQFPEPNGGGIVIVSYPFLFARGN